MLCCCVLYVVQRVEGSHEDLTAHIAQQAQLLLQQQQQEAIHENKRRPEAAAENAGEKKRVFASPTVGQGGTRIFGKRRKRVVGAHASSICMSCVCVMRCLCPRTPPSSAKWCASSTRSARPHCRRSGRSTFSLRCVLLHCSATIWCSLPRCCFVISAQGVQDTRDP